MKLISHRGNVNTIKENLENRPSYIQEALSLGYDVEIDVRLVEGELLLGHDFPVYKVDLDFLKNDKLWCHAKNLGALKLMLKERVQCFWHQEDDYTITSTGKIWTYPGKSVTENSIIVLKENFSNFDVESVKNCYGICADDIEKVKEILGL